MTAQLVKNMSDSDLLDMHYFLTEDEYFDGEEENVSVRGQKKIWLCRTEICNREYYAGNHGRIYQWYLH